jgi:3'(2'), 5'-bisphosphate nucleotidase
MARGRTESRTVATRVRCRPSCIHEAVTLALLGCPRLTTPDRQDGAGSIVYAVRDRGAFQMSLDGGIVPLCVSASRDPRNGRVLRSYEGRHISLRAFNEVIELLEVRPPPILMDSQGKHAVVAAGRADLPIRFPVERAFRDSIWDQGAGSIIVDEAGGRVTDLHGRPLDFAAGRVLARNEGVIVSNGHLHDAVPGASGE